MNQETSKKMIKIFEDAHESSSCPASYGPAHVGNEGALGGDVRSNLVMPVDYHDNELGDPCSCGMHEAMDFLRDIYVSCVNHYQEKYDVEIGFDEGFQLLKYGPGKEYKPHTDWGPGFEHRIVSGLIYLNPGEYEGGGTYFLNYNTLISPSTPSIALFPSNYAYKHRAKAVLSGNKYAIVTWMGR